MNESWKEYYIETEPKKRERIYKSLATDSAEDALRKVLFCWRHEGSKGREVDRVMAAMIDLMYIGRSGGLFSGARARKIVQSLGWDQVADAGEAGQELLLLELQNGAARYLSCCQDASYGAAFSGMMRADEGQQHARIAEDIWMATRGIEDLGTRGWSEEERAHLSAYEAAVLAAFHAFDEEAEQWLARYEENR